MALALACFSRSTRANKENGAPLLLEAGDCFVVVFGRSKKKKLDLSFFFLPAARASRGAALRGKEACSKSCAEGLQNLLLLCQRERARGKKRARLEEKGEGKRRDKKARVRTAAAAEIEKKIKAASSSWHFLSQFFSILFRGPILARGGSRFLWISRQFLRSQNSESSRVFAFRSTASKVFAHAHFPSSRIAAFAVGYRKKSLCRRRCRPT